MVSFLVELPFALLVPFGYLRLFAIDDAPGRAEALRLIGLVSLAKTVTLVLLLLWALRSLRRWIRAGADADGRLLLRAGDAAYCIPHRFSVVWAFFWAAMYFPVTIILDAGDRIPLGPSPIVATALFSVGLAAAAFPLAYVMIGWLLAPVTGRISLAARERGVALPSRGPSLHRRLATLTFCFALAPTSWMAGMSYMGELRGALGAAESRCAFDALSYAMSVEHEPALAGREPPVRTEVYHHAPLEEMPFVADAGGHIIAGRKAAEVLSALPALSYWLAEWAHRYDFGEHTDPRREVVVAFRRLRGGRVAGEVGRVVSPLPSESLYTLLLFVMVPMLWAPLCAVFLAGAVAGPVTRIATLVGGINVGNGLSQPTRIPVFSADEIGSLAENLNVLVDAQRERACLVRQLDAERSRLVAVLDEMPIGVMIAEIPSGRIAFTNKHITRILRTTFDREHPIREVQALRPSHPDGTPYRIEELPLIRAVVHGEVIHGEEMQGVRGDGSVAVIRVSASPLHDGADVAVLTIDDITDEKQLEAERERGARLRELFMGVLSHDLRNPLSTVKTGADYLLRAGLAEPQARIVVRIASSAERMKRMIEQLLDFTRTRLGAGIPLERRRTDLHDVCSRAVEELELAFPATTIRFNAHGQTVGDWDADRLAQVCSNLIGNAVQHGAPGEPIDVEVADAGDAAVIEVRNRGRPIPLETLPAIFDPFRQAPERRRGGGLGLGLYISQQIVKAHGGSIEVHSTDDETSFRVRLPKGLVEAHPVTLH